MLMHEMQIEGLLCAFGAILFLCLHSGKYNKNHDEEIP